MLKKRFKWVMALLAVCLLAIGSISYQQITASAASKQTYTASTTDQNKKVNVTVTADDDALPEGVSLKVTKIKQSESDYKTIQTKAKNQNKNKDISLLVYDIGFYKDGKEVEPTKAVQVSISWNSAIAPAGTTNSDTVSLVHLNDNNQLDNLTKKADISKQTNKVKSVSFTTSSFSPFALMWASTKSTSSTASTTTTTTTTEPLDVSSYITDVTIYYEVNGTKTKIEDNTTIPDSATSYSIEVKYAGIKSQDLLNKYGRQISYTLPSQLSSATVASDDVYDDSTPPQSVGTIKVQDGKILITFNESHLAGDENTTTSGTFTFTASIDRTKNTENPLTINFGNVTKTLNFQTHETAETGNLSIDKSTPTYIAGSDAVKAKEGYLEYTLTVKTGNDAMPDVKVEDSITSGSSYVSGYLVEGTKNGTATSLTGDPLAKGDVVTVTSNGQTSTVKINSDSATSMTWTIGDMAANETRTLTYRIKLNSDYVGVYNTTAITNTAKPYSKTYQHGSASQSFTPSEKATVNKTAGEVTTSNGKVTIPYTVTITADSHNTWPIRNLKINDHLQNSYKGLTNSDEIRKALCEYARFTNFSVKLGDKDITSTIVTDSNPITYYGSGSSDKNSAYNPSFDMYVGDVPAGTTLTLTYELQIDETIFTKLSRTWNIKNSVSVHTDDSKSSTGYNAEVGSSSSSKTIGTQIWDRKVAGNQTTETITQSPEGMESKTIAKGAIKYQVVVNEAGEWDVSDATFADKLGDHLKYAGYLQIDYYASGITYSQSGETVTVPSDSAALSKLKSQTITQTVYKLIDGETSFSLKPSDLGLSQKGAYVLTYYAVPYDVGSMSSFNATNTFSVSGSVVGPGGSNITMGASSVKVSNVISGGADFSTTKRSWYYDSLNNAAYWVIEATGTTLPNGLSLKDVTVSNNSSPEVVGAYVGTISTNNGHLSDAYNTISDFNSAKSSFEEFTDYTWQNNTFTLTSDLSLDNQKTLYIIIKTTRSTSTSNKRSTVVLQNKLQLKEVSEDDFRDVNTASLTTVAGGDVFKEFGAVYTRDSDGNWKVVKSGSSSNTSKIVTSKATEAGTYIEWRIKVNQLPNLSGYYDITDSLPDGVEAVYARYFWVDSTTAEADRPTMEEISDIGSSWDDIGLKDAKMDGSSSSLSAPTAYAYYNKTDNKIKFRVGNLKKALQDDSNYTSLNDKRSLEVQILVKVTDSDFLLGAEKTFTNSVSMADASGNEVGKDTSAVMTKTSTLTKSTTVSSETINGVVPFTLTVNPLSEDLVPNADTITVIDEMADPLSYDLSSVKVTNASGDDITSQVTIQDGGKTSDGKKILKFVVPDGQKLTITYNAIPYVSANTTFTISNTAYYEGASSGAKSTVNKSIKNSVSATSTTNRKPTITVTKRDASDVTKLLSGATFKLTPVKLNGDTWEDDGTALNATTDSDGQATFSGLEYNQVYKLEETKAPDGYNLDSTARYIVITQNTGTADNPTYPDAIKTYASHGATVQYSGYAYSVDISNTAGTALPNTGGTGTRLYYAVGIAVILSGGALLYWRKRKVGTK